MGGDARAAAKEVVEKNDARTLHDLAGVIKAFEGGMLSASTALAAIRHLVGDEVRVFLPQMERMGIPGPREKLYDYHQPGSRLTRPPIMATHMEECSGFLPGADPRYCLHCGIKIECHSGPIPANQ